MKKLEKEAALAAKKALKKAQGLVPPPAAGMGKKKEKVVKEVVKEPEFIEVPEGHMKGEPSERASSQVCGGTVY